MKVKAMNKRACLIPENKKDIFELNNDYYKAITMAFKLFNKFIQQGISFNKFESFVLYTNNASELIDIMYEKGYKI